MLYMEERRERIVDFVSNLFGIVGGVITMLGFVIIVNFCMYVYLYVCALTASPVALASWRRCCTSPPRRSSARKTRDDTRTDRPELT
jgi:hypothetical protein